MRDVQWWRRRGLLVVMAALAPALPLMVAAAEDERVADDVPTADGAAADGAAAGGGTAVVSMPRALLGPTSAPRSPEAVSPSSQASPRTPEPSPSASPAPSSSSQERCLEAIRPSTVRRPPAVPAEETGEVSGWARHPGDGRMYAVTSFGSLVRWDPETGRTDSGFPEAVVPRGNYGALVFDAAGHAYVETANPRRVYQIDLHASTGSSPVRLRSVGWARALGDVPLSPCMPVADFGDAPASYDAHGPASHRTDARLRLGSDASLEPAAAVSMDRAGRPVLDGRGDTGDDAVGRLPAIEPYMTRYTVRVPYVNRLGGPVTVAGWLDGDLSGTFDRDERYVVVEGPGDGTAELHWELPATHPSGTAHLRLRLYAGEVEDPEPGGAVDGPGEVEDHPVQVRGGPVADLSVQALPVETSPGGTGVLALLVRNHGPYGAEVDARVTVVPPKGVQLGRPPSSCRPRRDGALVCVLPAQRLPAGSAPVVHQLPFTIPSDARPETDLRGGTVTVTGARDPNTENNTAPLRIRTGAAVSDLGVRVVRKPSAAVPGRTARVNVEVRNAGPSDTAEDARLELRLPKDAAVPGRPPEGCRPTGRRDVVACTVPGGLAAGDSRRFTFSVRLAPGLAKGATLGGSVRVGLPGDPDRTDDTAPYELEAAAPVSRLSVRTVVQPRKVAPGETFTYTLRVHNRGPSDASDVRLVQDLPAALSVAGPLRLPGCTETGHRVRCGEERLRVGASATYEVTAKLSPVYGGDGSDLADAVTVTAATGPRREDDPARHRMPAGVAPPKVDVTVRVETSGGAITPGTSDRLTVTARNRGPSQTDGNGRHVITLPPGITAPARLPDGCSTRREGKRIVCRIPRGLLPGQEATWTLPVETGPAVPEGRVFRGGTVRVFAPRDPVADNDRTTFTIKAGPGLADLVMTKQPAARRQIGPGGVFTYELTVTNSGPSNASQVVIRDRLPAELSYVRVDDDCQVKGRTLECQPIPLLRRGEFETRHATVKLDPAYRGDGRGLSGPAQASSVTRDPDTSNNRSALDASGLPGGLVVYPPADLSVELGDPSVSGSEGRSTAEDVTAGTGLLPGRTAEFVLTVRNSGPFEAVRQSLVGTLPAPVRFVSSPDGCTASGHRFTCPGVESLGGGETVTRRVRLALAEVYGGDGTDLAVTVTTTSYSLDPDLLDNTVTWYPMKPIRSR